MLNLLLRLVATLPLRTVHAIGGFLGRMAYWLSPTYRRRLDENLERAGYTDAATRREAVAGACAWPTAASSWSPRFTRS